MRESNTVACEVRKNFLMLVQCYLPFTTLGKENSVIYEGCENIKL